MSAAELRAAAQACEQRALNAFRSNAILTARDDLEAARLFDERADRTDIVDAEVVDTRVDELLTALERIGDECRSVLDTRSEYMPDARLAQRILDIARGTT